LAEIAEQAGARGGVDDPAGISAVARLGGSTPMLRNSTANQPGTAKMDVHYQIKILNGHVPDGLVPDDPRIVDDDVDSPPLVDAAFHHRRSRSFVADVAIVGNGFVTARPDQVDDHIGVAPLPFALRIAAKVVDDQ